MPTLRTLFTTLLVFAAAACNGAAGDESEDLASQTPQTAAAGTADCEPIETRPPNAAGQSPAFPGQTRVCEIDSNVDFDVVVLADGLEHPWAVEPLPGGDLLVTEKPGRMRIVTASGEVGSPISGVPEVDARRQGGLLDVALSPKFAADRTVFWSFSEPRSGGNGTSVARGVLSSDRSSLEDVRVIFRAMPTYDGTMHYGSRLAFDPDGMLFITTGDRSDRPMREHAQRLDGHTGKVLRIAPDGSVPAGNPFVDEEGAEPEIWSFGHRNIQAVTVDPDGRLWVVEHGPRGGDELNLIEPGENYGWPLVSYGQEYSGEPIPDAETQREGYRQPVYYWDPVIAPSGAEWYTGSAFPEWRGSLFIGALREQRLVRLTVEDERVTGEEHLLTDRGQRIRDVKQGPDGALYIVTDDANGELWKVAPGG